MTDDLVKRLRDRCCCSIYGLISCNYCSAASELERMAARIVNLERVIAECARSVGAIAEPESSIELKLMVPGEIRSAIGKAIARAEAAETLLTRVMAEVERMPLPLARAIDAAMQRERG